MRIGLVQCSPAEIAALAGKGEWELVRADSGWVAEPDFDFAIFGFATVVGGGVSREVASRVACPAVLLVPSADALKDLDALFPAVTPDRVDEIPFLIRRERQLVFAHQLARTGSWQWDAATDEVRLSPSLLKLFAGEVHLSTLEEWLTRVHPDDVDGLRASFAATLREGVPTDVRYRMLRADGVTCLHTRAERVMEPLGLIGVSQDITEQAAAESALRDSEARYRTLVEHAKDTIVSVDLEGRILSLNRAAEELTGGSRIEWIGRSLFEALMPRSAEEARRRFEAVVSGAEPDDYAEYEVRTRHGRPSIVEAQVRAVRSRGEVVGLVMVARDITARKASEGRAEQEKRLASLGQLATSVAHEFNNVLMSISPFAELMRRRFPDDPQIGKATRHIADAVRRGREISQEILRFARPSNPQLVPLTITEWAEDFRRRAKDILGPLYRVTLSLPPRQVSVFADRALLDQVATNLTLNARDAMPEGGAFEIRVGVEEKFVLIDFRDSGCGIEPDLFDRIFEPLYTTKQDGNGLGLSIAHQAMVQQNGTIKVQSQVGKGSTFTIAMPELVRSAAAHRSAREKRRVLIVEDDESVGEGLRILLSDEGFDVKLVGTGLEAMPALESFRPEMVLLDVNLPDISGIEVYDRIRAIAPELPVIFSTGHADARALADVKQREVPSIMKPYEIEELLALMAAQHR